MTACAYCQSAVEDHEPVYVREADAADERAFCNYACLVAFVEDEELTAGACCQWSPS